MVYVEFLMATAAGEQIFSKLAVSPATQSVYSYQNSIVTQDSVFCSTSEPVLGLSLVPGIYKCRTYGKNTDSQFYINASNSYDNSTQSAANLIYFLW